MGAPMYAMEDAGAVLRGWREFMASAPDEVSSNVLFWSLPPAPVFPEPMHGRPILIVAAMYAGDPEQGARVLQPLRELATPLIDISSPMPYVIAQSAFDPFFPRGILQGEAGSFGPPNLVALTPEVILLPTPDFWIGCRWSFYWRQSLDDGLYSLNLFPYAPAGTGDERYIGRELSLTFGWNLDRHVGFWTVFSFTETGDFLEDSGYVEDQIFYSATITIRF